MSKMNRNLLLIVALLFLLSVLTYRQSLDRADRFQRGQRFLANLNPDDVATLVVTKGEDTVTLKRQGDRFVVAEKRDFPASNSAVNGSVVSLACDGVEFTVIILVVPPKTVPQADKTNSSGRAASGRMADANLVLRIMTPPERGNRPQT